MCKERQIYTVILKVNTVIAIGHEMIFVYTESIKLSSTSWGLTTVDHQAHCYYYYSTMGLNPVLSSLKANFDLIGITETKQQIGKDFLVNVDVNDYFMYTQPSKLASGGVAIYVKDNLDHSGIDDVYYK